MYSPSCRFWNTWGTEYTDSVDCSKCILWATNWRSQCISCAKSKSCNHGNMFFELTVLILLHTLRTLWLDHFLDDNEFIDLNTLGILKLSHIRIDAIVNIFQIPHFFPSSQWSFLTALKQSSFVNRNRNGRNAPWLNGGDVLAGMNKLSKYGYKRTV